MHRLIAFDDGKGVLSPLTDLRAAFNVRTGALTTLERVRRWLGASVVGLWVPEAARALTRHAHSEPVNTWPAGDAPLYVYNGRCVIPPARLRELKPGEIITEAGTGDLVAGLLAPEVARRAVLGEPVPGTVVADLPAPAMLSRPWHVRRFRDTAIKLDLELLARRTPQGPDDATSDQELFELPSGGLTISGQGPEPLRIGGGPLTIRGGARVYPGVVLDVEHGGIVIDENAMVRPGAILIGPAYVGPSSVVLERATIRPNTAIGPFCKVNGEVGGTILQGYSNKAHDGYLGDSWLGEWVNLGAGTTNSNLLNTYGEVTAIATPVGSHERTGEQFLGAIIGDHVKTAICTRIMTGSVLHIGGMFASTAPISGCTPPFAWVTDQGPRRYRAPKFIEVVRAAMARRKVEPGEAYLERLSALLASGE